MPAKIATAEDLQTELRTLLAMTEEANPSRAKLADAISDLASRVAADTGILKEVRYSQSLILFKRINAQIKDQFNTIVTAVSSSREDPVKFITMMEQMEMSLDKVQDLVKEYRDELEERISRAKSVKLAAAKNPRVFPTNTKRRS